MQTLAEIENRIKRMEGHLYNTEASVNASIRDDVNESYRELSSIEPWYWLITTDTIAATSSNTELVMPRKTSHILSVHDSSGKQLLPRDRLKQLNARDRIAGIGYVTYSLGKIDDATGFECIMLEPPTGGNYSVRSCLTPDDLTADDDLPLGVDSVADFLVWRTRWLRLHADEERVHLRNEALRRSEMALDRLKKRNKMMLHEHTRGIYQSR